MRPCPRVIAQAKPVFPAGRIGCNPYRILKKGDAPRHAAMHAGGVIPLPWAAPDRRDMHWGFRQRNDGAIARDSFEAASHALSPP
jgi:hypothetical protein